MICYNSGGVLNGILTPQMINPTGWAWRGYAGFLWGGLTLLLILWCYYRLPEIRGKTLAEIDELFRDGKDQEVEPDDGHCLERHPK